ncbi:phage tail tape measure protein [Sphingobacterium lactis]|uniref:phage tail tape measure protein n=1 Tax=Sphingobacterium lactis TaxID=797291 RepID=UPI003EC4B868
MSLIAEIQANIDNFNSNLDKAQARMDAFANGIGKKIAEVGQSFQMIGGALSIAVTAPLIAAGTAAYNMAADFEDALGATDQIFKEASEATQAWANSLPTYYGIAKKEALEYSNMMGSMLVNIGNLTEKEASQQSAKLIELAGDLTAMYGGTTQDAVRALTGALKGNTTMLDNYGMAANDALVKAKAYSMGLVEQGKELDLVSKQAATLALIYEQSAAAQGQAARESDGASGSMRALKTEISNLTTELGANLLPIITPIVTKIKEIAAGFRSLSPEAQKTIAVVAAVAAAIGPMLLALGSLMQLAPLVGTAFATMTGPIGIAVVAIGAAVALIIKYWDEIKAYFTNGAGSKVWSNISNGAQQLWAKIVAIFEKVKTFMLDVWGKIGSNVKSIVGNTFTTILSIVESVINHISGVIDVFSSLLSGDFSGAIKAVGRLFENVFNTIKNIGLNVFANISQAIAGFLKLVGADQMGASLENWANGLRPVKEQTELLATTVEEGTKKLNTYEGKIKGVTDGLNGNSEALNKNSKSQKDYREELDSTLASFGIYDYQIKEISTRFKKIEENAKKAGASLKEFGLIASEEAKQKLEVLKTSTNNLFTDLTTGLKSFKVTGLSNPEITIPLKVKVDGDFNEASEVINKKIRETAEIAREEARRIAEDFDNIISEGVYNMADSLGQAFVDQTNVLAAIGSSLLSTAGGILKNLGKIAIQEGIMVAGMGKALAAAVAALKSLNPYVAIAAGVALVALGSAFSAGAARLGNSMESSGGASSSNYTSSATSSSNNLPRGAYYNNDKQVVEFKLKNGDLNGAIKWGNTRNTRLG